jgi:hypothetical protein
VASVNSVVVAVNNFGDTRSGGLAGPMGLFIIVLMCVAVVLLIRNMNKRLRRLPDSFPNQADAERDAEITRLEAQAARTDSAPQRPGFDGNRSAASDVVADAEVSDVERRDPGTSAGGLA